MNMNIMITKFGKERLPLICESEQIKTIVSELIATFDDSFSFSQLCNEFIFEADKLNLLRKEANTIYQGGIELSFGDIDIINLVVWEMIWEKKLMIALYKNPYRSHNDGDFILLKVEQKGQ